MQWLELDTLGSPLACYHSDAPSIASDSFDGDKEKLKELIGRLDYVSVREASTISSVSVYTDKAVRSVVDPTLLLEVSNYRKIEDTRLRNKIFRKYKASGYAGVEAIFERDQRNQKFIWGMYDRICGMFCRKTR